MQCAVCVKLSDWYRNRNRGLRDDGAVDLLRKGLIRAQLASFRFLQLNFALVKHWLLFHSPFAFLVIICGQPI